MKAKLTRQEFNALADIVKALLSQLDAEDLYNKLLIIMMQRLMIELEQKRMVVKPAYKINWHPERALAFAIVAGECRLQAHTYEGALVIKLCNQINQQLCNLQP